MANEGTPKYLVQRQPKVVPPEVNPELPGGGFDHYNSSRFANKMLNSGHFRRSEVIVNSRSALIRIQSG